VLKFSDAYGWTRYPDELRRSAKHTPNGVITPTIHRRKHRCVAQTEGSDSEEKLPKLGAFLNGKQDGPLHP
jgi:hypothetical protein